MGVWVMGVLWLRCGAVCATWVCPCWAPPLIPPLKHHRTENNNPTHPITPAPHLTNLTNLITPLHTTSLSLLVTVFWCDCGLAPWGNGVWKTQQT